MNKSSNVVIELVGERERLRKRVEEIEADLQLARRELSDAETAIRVLRRMEGGFQPESIEHAGTIADAVERVLVQFGGEAALGEIVQVLREAGRLKGAPQSHYGNVVTSMDREPVRFVRVRRGHWGLTSRCEEDVVSAAS